MAQADVFQLSSYYDAKGQEPRAKGQGPSFKELKPLPLFPLTHLGLHHLVTSFSKINKKGRALAALEQQDCKETHPSYTRSVAQVASQVGTSRS